MADYTITISNAFNTFGPAPSSLWGVMLWSDSGAGKWGEGSTTLQLDVIKLISESLAPSDAFSTAADFTITTEDALSVASETTDMELTDGSGYSYSFRSAVTDADDRASTSYSDGSDPSTTWFNPSDPSTTWS